MESCRNALFKRQFDKFRLSSTRGERFSHRNAVIMVERFEQSLRRDVYRTVFAENVFHADAAFRADRIVTLYGETLDKPAKRLKEKDDKRRTYYRHYTGRTWGAAENFDLALDTGRLGVEHCADIVVKVVEELNK